MNNKNFFTTYDGSKIKFLPYLVNHELNKKIPTYHLDNETKAKKNIFSRYNLFLKGLFKSNIFLNYLEKNNLTNKFRSHLDIGGREAGVGAILKTIGTVESSTTTDMFNHQVKFNYLEKILFNIFILGFDPKKRYNKFMKDFYFNIPVNYFYKNFFKIKNVDDYKVVDFKNFHTKRRFDLVTTIGTLCYLDVEKYFQIVKKITSKGALVYIHSDHFFFPINSSKFLGNFPYCNQRLSMKDLKKYIGINHSEVKNLLYQNVSYYNSGNPVPINKIIKIAKKYGFKLVKADRWKIEDDTENMSINVPYDFLQLSKNKILLDQIQKNYPDVIAEDLITRYFELGFYKE